MGSTKLERDLPKNQYKNDFRRSLILFCYIIHTLKVFTYKNYLVHAVAYEAEFTDSVSRKRANGDNELRLK